MGWIAVCVGAATVRERDNVSVAHAIDALLSGGVVVVCASGTARERDDVASDDYEHHASEQTGNCTHR